MTTPATDPARIIPAMNYRDPKAAIEFLCTALGFEKHAVYEEGGEVVHAQLVFGNGMVMLGPVHDGEFGRMMIQPDETEGRVTQSICVIVDDVDAHCHKATANGARIVFAPKDESYGGRSYTCADPEGHLWTFGSYDPWAG
jgi:uncharacterized glyoxalase superfamily protein PhnB